MRTVAQALLDARALGVDRLDALLILSRQLGRSRSWLIAHDDAELDTATSRAIETMFARRRDGEPLAYLLGEKEFYGLLLHVDANVLVPRPETELLVDWALELLAGRVGAQVIDLGTGSGAIALAVKHGCRAANVLATDASAPALTVARANARRLGLEVAFAAGSWWAAAGERCFDLVLSNPPYVAAGDPHLAALRHEPGSALTPGGDGLDALREIAAGAAARMTPGAWLLLEHGHDQAEPVQSMLRAQGFAGIETRRDVAGQPRCTGAHR